MSTIILRSTWHCDAVLPTGDPPLPISERKTLRLPSVCDAANRTCVRRWSSHARVSNCDRLVSNGWSIKITRRRLCARPLVRQRDRNRKLQAAQRQSTCPSQEKRYPSTVAIAREIGYSNSQRNRVSPGRRRDVSTSCLSYQR
jgi:hypothetical protein